MANHIEFFCVTMVNPRFWESGLGASKIRSENFYIHIRCLHLSCVVLSDLAGLTGLDSCGLAWHGLHWPVLAWLDLA